MKPKHILFFLISCYLFSLGMFTAHVFDRIQLNRTFQNDLQELNRLSSQKTELLKMLKQDMYQDEMAASHIEAIIQKNPHYEYSNLLTATSEQASLNSFYTNFIFAVGKFYPNSASLVQSLLFLEQDIKEQQDKTMQDLSNLL